MSSGVRNERPKMNTTYKLTVIGRDTIGDNAASPALARLAPGAMTLSDPPELLGVLLCEYVVDNGRHYLRAHTLIEAEDFPGQWQIGVPGGEKFRAGRVEK
jgi:hypothetical protein